MKRENENERRSFLKSLAGLTAGIMLPAHFSGLQASPASSGSKAVFPSDKWGELLPQRKFGNTGEAVTMLGLGGAHIARMQESEAEKTIERAIEGGFGFLIMRNPTAMEEEKKGMANT